MKKSTSILKTKFGLSVFLFTLLFMLAGIVSAIKIFSNYDEIALFGISASAFVKEKILPANLCAILFLFTTFSGGIFSLSSFLSAFFCSFINTYAFVLTVYLLHTDVFSTLLACLILCSGLFLYCLLSAYICSVSLKNTFVFFRSMLVDKSSVIRNALLLSFYSLFSCSLLYISLIFLVSRF